MSINVVIKSIASTRVVALREVVASYYAQTPLWSRTTEFVSAHGLTTPQATESFSVFHDVGFKQADVDTEVCVPIDATADVKDAGDFKIYDVPEVPRAASVTHKGPYKGLVAVYRELFGWIGAQGETVNGKIREIYHVGANTTPDFEDEEFVTEIIVPLK